MLQFEDYIKFVTKMLAFLTTIFLYKYTQFLFIGSSLVILIALLVVSAVILGGFIIFTSTDASIKGLTYAIMSSVYGTIALHYALLVSISVPFTISFFLFYFLRWDCRGEIDLNRFLQAAFVALSFIFGVTLNSISSTVCMFSLVKLSSRTASALKSHRYGKALQLPMKGTLYVAILSISLALLGFLVLYVALVSFLDEDEKWKAPLLIVPYALGATILSFFSQLEGTIFMRAAQCGSTAVTTRNIGIHEDDIFNPALVARIIGIMVGDGLSVLNEFFEVTVMLCISMAMIGSILAYERFGAFPTVDNPMNFVLYPVVYLELSLVISFICVHTTKTSSPTTPSTLPLSEDASSILKRTYAVQCLLSMALIIFITPLMLYTETAPNIWWHYTICGIIGICTQVLLLFLFRYYSNFTHKPVKRTAKSTWVGISESIVSGLSFGLESVVVISITILASLIISFWVGNTGGFYNIGGNRIGGVYGVIVAMVGFLSPSGFLLGIALFSPATTIAGSILRSGSNACGIGEPANVVQRYSKLGKASGFIIKGYLIVITVLVSLSLCFAYMDEVSIYLYDPGFSISLGDVEVLIGGILGALSSVFVGSWALTSVRGLSEDAAKEMHKQLLETSDIIDRTSIPSYSRIIRKMTFSSLKMMIVPAAWSIMFPFVVGFIFWLDGFATARLSLSSEVVASMLMCTSFTTLIIATFFHTSGGIWSSVLNYFENSILDGDDACVFDAAVSGHEVGDPLKDCAAPSIRAVMKIIGCVGNYSARALSYFIPTF